MIVPPRILDAALAAARPDCKIDAEYNCECHACAKTYTYAAQKIKVDKNSEMSLKCPHCGTDDWIGKMPPLPPEFFEPCDRRDSMMAFRFCFPPLPMFRAVCDNDNCPHGGAEVDCIDARVGVKGAMGAYNQNLCADCFYSHRDAWAEASVQVEVVKSGEGGTR